MTKVNCNFMSDAKKKTGREGEQLALDFLEKKDLKVLDRNFTLWGGEVDLIMEDNSIDKEIVFVEVKTKRTQDVEFSETITKKQINTIIKSAEVWLLKNGLENEDWRIDVVGVLLLPGEKPEIEWIEDAVSG